MRMFPVEFIDNSIFDKYKEEINGLRNQILGVTAMHENIQNYLKVNEEDKKKLSIENKEINSKIDINQRENSLAISNISSKLDRILSEMSNLRKDIDNQNTGFEKYKLEHKAKHEEHISLLDRIFSK